MKVISHMHSDFSSKFGVTRQSGIIDSVKAHIVFEPEFRNSDMLRGLDGFSYTWIIWKFSEATRTTWSPLFRPPRLGGSQKMGVMATGSPFRPNSIGLSSVKNSYIEVSTTLGPISHVLGADLLGNTPFFDLKPYLSYTDSHPDAKCGFTDTAEY